ncbi:acyl-CoA dehydratase activase [Pelotomaculum propionicicum]|uniref:Activator of (R)-2-hydroxyglutaryl-CoA dehydratase n=1 Tax=Pelotomaculum propionicicum TaxID=258475 RepID=A0A4Y7RP35_9FIRM|nr:acyl-CoA dehydratase activase [Pelotomaculum propionicicum]NLI12361.1 2-hydroxyglutaryl-CoA dehydratase [Peptococcaceae bacterium]TEB10077.1 Activator of (R)-2-hydroxyglutaryl-CoA dehydratase [Pelotomaculum propionicicum]
MNGYLGVDVGSVSTNIVFMDEGGVVFEAIYLRTLGQPIATVQKGLRELGGRLPAGTKIKGVGATGSGRNLIGVIIGADAVKNEITSHAVATSQVVPGVQTILEIGGQDSKIIILRNGVVSDFAMNTVCAAGTGSFLDQQAARLNISIEEFGEIALRAASPVRIAGRCAVFAESDMIHKQQMGCSLADILAGLCEALVRNYLNNVGKGKEILAPVVFQGGVAANVGMIRAFEKELGLPVKVPPYFNVMGAVGAALLSREAVARKGPSCFKGFRVSEMDFRTGSFECSGCSNLCEVIEIKEEGDTIARWGDRCGKWSSVVRREEKIS